MRVPNEGIKLNKIIDDDKEYKSIAIEACGYCGDAWSLMLPTRDNAENEAIRNLSIQELFAQFKCVRSWQLLIKNIFRTLDDTPIDLPGTTEQVVFNSPTGNSRVRFSLHTDKEYITMSYNRALTVKNLVTGKESKRVIKLELVKPEYTALGSTANSISVSLANSMMKMTISFSFISNSPIHEEVIKVKDFTKNTLINLIKASL